MSTEGAPFRTINVLRGLGFSDEPGSDAVRWDFGNGQLTAQEVFTSAAARVVKLSGRFHTPSTLSEIDSLLPLSVVSVKQGIAFLAFTLKNATLAERPAWLDDGLCWQDELAWVREAQAHVVRAKCCVEREWLRLALNMLRTLAQEATGNEVVLFEFDGKTLALSTKSERIARGAEGGRGGRTYAGALQGPQGPAHSPIHGPS